MGKNHYRSGFGKNFTDKDDIPTIVCIETDTMVAACLNEEIQMFIEAAMNEKEVSMNKPVVEAKPVACETCNGTGMEICNNPDHGFIVAMGAVKSDKFDTGRLGCPACGHDELHRVPNTKCDKCFGTGKPTPPVEVQPVDYKALQDLCKLLYENMFNLKERGLPKDSICGNMEALIKNFIHYYTAEALQAKEAENKRLRFELKKQKRNFKVLLLAVENCREKHNMSVVAIPMWIKEIDQAIGGGDE